MKVGIGVLGAGTVGGTLVRRLVDDAATIAEKTGLELEVVKVAVRDLGAQRRFEVGEGLLTDNPEELVDDPDVQLVVEVMGGLEPAGSMVLRALNAGKPVVTANKELVSLRGPELIEAANAKGVQLLFEAAVGGGIPIIRPLSESLAGEPVTRVIGIVNGTTNFILTRMEEGLGFDEALTEAQELGYAEPDPSADISGADAAAKAAILASLAFGTWVSRDTIPFEGIDALDARDVEFARQLGYVPKLLAVAERLPQVAVRVHPALVPLDHPLASVRGPQNAIYVEGASVGELLFSGPGAGGEPTATAVLGDVIDATRQLLAGSQTASRVRFGEVEMLDPDEVVTEWYYRLEVADQPGVLAAISMAFGEAGVSIKSVWQEGRGDDATLLLVTHDAREGSQRAAWRAVQNLDVVRARGAVIRVLDTDD